jgi:hypothetical protein
MPAFTVSTNTPLASAGEYGDTRLARGGSGCGGAGSRLAFWGGKGALPVALNLTGCLPLLDVGALVAGAAGAVGTDTVVYGGRGILSGFIRCIWNEIISSNSLSIRDKDAKTCQHLPHNQHIRDERVRGREMRRTGFDCAVHETAVLLPLHAHAAWVFPITRVGLVDFVQCAEPEAVRSICDVLAERPPETLLS